MYFVFAADNNPSDMSSLFVCEEPKTWRKVYDKYWNVVEAKAQGKKTGNLLKLDKWYILKYIYLLFPFLL